MLKNLLLYRFILVNLIMLAGLGVAYNHGLIQHVLEGDTTGIVYAIVALFLICWVNTARRAYQVGHELNSLKDRGQGGVIATMNAQMRNKTEWMRDTSNWLVGLGLIGTVVGFGVALSGIDQSSLAEASGVQGSIGKLMEGMRIALNTTIAGAVLGMWNEINQRMYKTALEGLLFKLADVGFTVHFGDEKAKIG